MRRLLLLSCSLVLALSLSRDARADFVPPWLAGDSRPEDLVISLVTFGPGEEVHQYFGHTAIEVRDRKLGVSALYNFGMFSFDQTFLLKFLKGHLEFWLGVQPTDLSYDFYAEQDRDVRVLELDLPVAKAGEMAHALAVHALPQNRVYLYHHYYDNCATRIVDAIDGATDGAFKRALQEPARMSYRAHTRRYAARDPLIDWLLVFAMNDDMEKPIRRVNELFLPDELESAVASFHYEVDGRDRPLVRSRRMIYEARHKPIVYDVPPVTWPYNLALGSFFGAALAWLGSRAARPGGRGARFTFGVLSALFGLAFGLLGLTVTGLALFTEHQVTYWNENLFFASPLTLTLLVTGLGVAFRDKYRGAVFKCWAAVAVVGTLGVVLKVLPWFDQDTTLVWTLLVPIEIGGALGALAMTRVQASGVPSSAALATPPA